MDDILFSIPVTELTLTLFLLTLLIIVPLIGSGFTADKRLREAHDIRLDYERKLAQLEKRIADQEKIEQDFFSKRDKLEEDFSSYKRHLTAECATLRRQYLSYKRELKEKMECLRAQFEEYKSNLFSDNAAYQLVNSEQGQSRPELSKLYADLICERDQTIISRLLSKDRPALKAADVISQISREKRMLIVENKMLKFQLDFFESLFPWLEEFKEIPINEAISYANVSSPEGDSEYDHLKKWLSPEEYQSLSSVEKYQLALDRWTNRSKSDWEIGIEYERYIGYQLETKGYHVDYFGAKMGLGDMGRDLIATKDGVSLVIQCKRWAKSKTIHEKHICQLYGSVAVLATQNPDKQYKGVFIASASLSETARLFAEYSNIQYVESCPMADYPVIKCNLSNNGEKIYHLPFDQQYDRVIISPEKGEFFAMTVAEAEASGFRRAFRWHSS